MIFVYVHTQDLATQKRTLVYLKSRTIYGSERAHLDDCCWNSSLYLLYSLISVDISQIILSTLEIIDGARSIEPDSQWIMNPIENPWIPLVCLILNRPKNNQKSIIFIGKRQYRQNQLCEQAFHCFSRDHSVCRFVHGSRMVDDNI